MNVRNKAHACSNEVRHAAVADEVVRQVYVREYAALHHRLLATRGIGASAHLLDVHSR